MRAWNLFFKTRIMRRFVVGGNFGDDLKQSSIVKKLATSLFADLFNGGTIENLETATKMVVDYDLVVWMPNISNEIDKKYPRKKKGSILICSKVIRGEVSDENLGEAVGRIFKMNANAVIAIYKMGDKYRFKLIDALGNLWIDTDDVIELRKSIEKLAYWTKESIRVNSEKVEKETNSEVEQDFCDIIKVVSEKVESERGGRYFGNASTRCSFTFPSQRTLDSIFVSGRNTPKDFLTPEDFIPVNLVDDKITYSGDRKPSVDTSIQLELYKKFTKINYIIHGHAYIEGVNMTDHYFPCGDMREVDSIVEALDKSYNLCETCLNLRNHGFIIFAETLSELKNFVSSAKFQYRDICEEITYE